MRRFALIVMALFPLLSENVTQAQSVLIPVSTRRDLVYDPLRNLLYITTTAGLVQRYDVASQSLLTPFAVGTSLNGADITPDNGSLFVAENTPSPTQGFLRRVDLNNGSIITIPYDRDESESGAWDVTILNNNQGFLSTRFAGSGWVPLRRINVTNNSLSIVTDPTIGGFGTEVRQDSHLTRAGNRDWMLLQESNSSNGPIHKFGVATNSFSHHRDLDYSQTNIMAAANFDGSLFAIEAPGSHMSILNSNLATIQSLAGYDSGMIFDPSSDLLFAARSSDDRIVAISTSNWSVVGTYLIGENIASSNSSPFGIGKMAISPDGERVFMNTAQGVRMILVPEPTSFMSIAILVGLAALRRNRRR